MGTVDKFQGQEAPIAIYSMATSSHADAPRGMEFLYSLNRLNVATSRAKCLSIIVSSPQVFEADCRTPAADSARQCPLPLSGAGRRDRYWCCFFASGACRGSRSTLISYKVTSTADLWQGASTYLSWQGLDCSRWPSPFRRSCLRARAGSPWLPGDPSRDFAPVHDPGRPVAHRH